MPVRGSRYRCGLINTCGDWRTAAVGAASANPAAETAGAAVDGLESSGHDQAFIVVAGPDDSGRGSAIRSG
jgi:hypothetical protein